MENVLQTILLSMIVIFGGYIIARIIASGGVGNAILKTVIKYLPTGIDLAKDIMDIKEPNSGKNLEKIEYIVDIAVNAVEMYNKNKDSIDKLSSIDKKNLAIEYIDELAIKFNIKELGDFEGRVLDILIEAAVRKLN